MSLSAYIQPVWHMKMGTGFKYGEDSAIYNAGDTPLTTDWDHPSPPADPIPYGWDTFHSANPPSLEVSVVTGNGFSGNAVRVEVIEDIFMSLSSYNMEHGLHEPIWKNTYLLEFSYRSNVPIIPAIRDHNIGGFDLRWFGEFGTYLPANTGNAVKVRLRHTFNDITTPWGNIIGFVWNSFHFRGVDPNLEDELKWMEIDGIRLWKLNKSPIIVIQEVEEIEDPLSNRIKGYTNVAHVQLQVLDGSDWVDYGTSQTGAYYNEYHLLYTQPPKRNEFRVKAWNNVGTYFYSNVYEI